MEFILITNDLARAQLAERAGVDRIMVDLEVEGKRERQGHLDTVISGHSIEDVTVIRGVLRTAQLMVRINPLSDRSASEIDACVSAGADVIMLPMFKSRNEVERFVGLVRGRARVNLLLETPQALEGAEGILSCAGVDEVHVGLNDLHLALELGFMFELVANGVVERLAGQARARGIRFGFGGVARLGRGRLSPHLILSEHIRLGSKMVILSRDFHGESDIDREVRALRECLTELRAASPEWLTENLQELKRVVSRIR